MRPPLVGRGHDDGYADGRHEAEHDVEIPEQDGHESYYKAVSQVIKRPVELEYSKDPWEVLQKALKRIIEAAGGTFSHLDDQWRVIA